MSTKETRLFRERVKNTWAFKRLNKVTKDFIIGDFGISATKKGLVLIAVFGEDETTTSIVKELWLRNIDIEFEIVSYD